MRRARAEGEPPTVLFAAAGILDVPDGGTIPEQERTAAAHALRHAHPPDTDLLSRVLDGLRRL